MQAESRASRLTWSCLGICFGAWSASLYVSVHEIFVFLTFTFKGRHLQSQFTKIQRIDYANVRRPSRGKVFVFFIRFFAPDAVAFLLRITEVDAKPEGLTIWHLACQLDMVVVPDNYVIKLLGMSSELQALLPKVLEHDMSNDFMKVPKCDSD